MHEFHEMNFKMCENSTHIIFYFRWLFPHWNHDMPWGMHLKLIAFMVLYCSFFLGDFQSTLNIIFLLKKGVHSRFGMNCYIRCDLNVNSKILTNRLFWKAYHNCSKCLVVIKYSVIILFENIKKAILKQPVDDVEVLTEYITKIPLSISYFQQNRSNTFIREINIRKESVTFQT